MPKENKPEISVLIPTYNSSHTLHYTLQSVLAQTHQDFEIWVIGDACTDNTEEVIQAFQEQRIHWFNLSKNSGSQPAPNNEGLRRAQGKYIAYLGHDDLWHPEHLACLYQLCENQEVDFCYAMTADLFPDGRAWARAQPIIGRNPSNFIPPSTWFHRKKLLQETGYWAENYMELQINPDMEFFNRLSKASVRTQLYPALTVFKIASAYFSSYSRKKETAQALHEAWEKLRENPEAYRQEILTAVALEFSRYHPRLVLFSRAYCIKMILRNFYHSVKKRWGHIWPLTWVFNKIYRGLRKKMNKERGLIPSKNHPLSQGLPRG